MGCAQSKIDKEESVSRCKERRNLMKEAVVARNAFASAHSGYSVSLKDTGTALSDFADGEIPPPPLVTAVPENPPVVDRPPLPPLSPMESNLPPPPPPLPSFSPMPPLQRAVTMPAALSESVRKGKMKGVAVHEENIYEDEEEDEQEERFRRRKKGVEEAEVETPVRPPPNPSTTPSEIKGMVWDYFFTDNMPGSNLDEVREKGEGGNAEGMNGNLDQAFENVAGNDEFKTPEKQVGFDEMEVFKTPEETPAPVLEPAPKFMHSNTAPPAMSRTVIGGSAAGNENGVDLLKIISEIDDHFLKASQSSHTVSKMLEAMRLHYHSNFADNRGHIDHAARVMQVITWNKSFKGIPNGEAENDSFHPDDYETHAAVLNKLLAWEKKLYVEIKAGELMKREYQRKVGVLNKLKKRNASAEQLEKAKAAVSYLHTRYIVDMQSLDSTVSEVNDIRDRQLFPKLVALVHGMTTMWESMCVHHSSQLELVTGLKSLDISNVLIETTKHHHDRTKQLATVLDQWHSHFEKLVTGLRQYITGLFKWLKLNLIPIESSLKEKVPSPPRAPNEPPIQLLLRAWHDYLEKLPDEVAKGAIASFAAVIKTIILHQEEEMRLKEKCEETRREYVRKKQAFEEWHHKYMNRRTPPADEGDPDKAGESGTRGPVAEKQFVVESLKKRMDKEMEDHQKHCVQVREKSLGSLKIRLPEIVRALSDHAHACFEAYERLRLLTESQHPNPNAGA
ncbi:protein ALTERED PHOSPHATE STARVATION RESPONSE 1-like [Salvia divinorum]|uniref:Protein ALTERED PHOSPHATE STARVATION RESPONSE 1-like n=1 Tax=Salvia divinorum TaxID=28513 RepID=A0ABD1I0G2_SALDI